MKTMQEMKRPMIHKTNKPWRFWTLSGLRWFRFLSSFPRLSFVIKLSLKFISATFFAMRPCSTYLWMHKKHVADETRSKIKFLPFDKMIEKFCVRWVCLQSDHMIIGKDTETCRLERLEKFFRPFDVHEVTAAC